MVDPGPPQEMKRLYDWLLAEGFSVVEDRADDLHNRLLVLVRDDCRIRLLADRGDWSLAISFETREWIHPDVWESHLDEFPLAGDLSDLDHQVQFLQNRLPEIVAMAGPDLDRELLRIGEEYMRRRLGIGPE